MSLYTKPKLRKTRTTLLWGKNQHSWTRNRNSRT